MMLWWIAAHIWGDIDANLGGFQSGTGTMASTRPAASSACHASFSSSARTSRQVSALISHDLCHCKSSRLLCTDPEYLCVLFHLVMCAMPLWMALAWLLCLLKLHCLSKFKHKFLECRWILRVPYCGLLRCVCPSCVCVTTILRFRNDCVSVAWIRSHLHMYTVSMHHLQNSQ